MYLSYTNHRHHRCQFVSIHLLWQKQIAAFQYELSFSFIVQYMYLSYISHKHHRHQFMSNHLFQWRQIAAFWYNLSFSFIIQYMYLSYTSHKYYKHQFTSNHLFWWKYIIIFCKKLYFYIVKITSEENYTETDHMINTQHEFIKFWNFISEFLFFFFSLCTRIFVHIKS